MSRIIDEIRNMITKENSTKMKINEIWRKLQIVNSIKFGNTVTKDNLLETLHYYKKLSILWIDNEENVILL
jgi:uncharacterized protein YfkK (UPF0435 family)